MRADRYGSRVGLVAKTEMSDYGFFVNNGEPAFSVFAGGRYATARAEDPTLGTNTWHHIAGVYDGEEVRLYVDGKLESSAAAEGERGVNSLPLMIGSDVNRDGNPTSFFDGQISAVRLSHGARYKGASFTPPSGSTRTRRRSSA